MTHAIGLEDDRVKEREANWLDAMRRDERIALGGHMAGLSKSVITSRDMPGNSNDLDMTKPEPKDLKQRKQTSYQQESNIPKVQHVRIRRRCSNWVCAGWIDKYSNQAVDS